MQAIQDVGYHPVMMSVEDIATEAGGEEGAAAEPQPLTSEGEEGGASGNEQEDETPSLTCAVSHLRLAGEP